MTGTQVLKPSYQNMNGSRVSIRDNHTPHNYYNNIIPHRKQGRGGDKGGYKQRNAVSRSTLESMGWAEKIADKPTLWLKPGMAVV